MIVKTCIYPKNNFGDSAINSYLVEKITGKKPNLMSISKNKDIDNFLISGSVLASADEKSIVWGAGFLDENDKMEAKPKRICAVRGRLSRKKLLEQSISCPETFGDPTLLLPRFYWPEVEKTDKTGLIPHYKDYDLALQYIHDKPNFKIIDICGGVERVIDEVFSCRFIMSSSLHGLIIADAYGIPSQLIKFSGNLLGGGFKFLDYFSVKGKVDLDKLWEACPFRNGNE